MSIHEAKPEHQVVFEELSTLLRRHVEKLSALEVLAIAANMVGKLVALQDQRVTTPAQALEIVARNLEMGNREAMIELQSLTTKTAH